jgi:hypothetical protein
LNRPLSSTADAAAATKIEGTTPADPSVVGIVPSLAGPSAAVTSNTSTNTAPSPSAPYVLASRSRPPTAAFAVPLSLVAAILLVAGGLSLHHRRKLGAERTRDAEQLALSRQSSLNSFKSSSTRSDDVEHALSVLSRNGAPVPVPLFMPVDVRREPRQFTREAYPQYTAPSHQSTNEITSTYYARTTASPVHSPPKHQYLPPITTSTRGLLDEDEDNATATHSVISSYMQPSPIPPSCLLSAPERLHIRTEAVEAPLPQNTKLFEYVDKPLPPSPQPEAPSANVYDVISAKLGIRHQT